MFRCLPIVVYTRNSARNWVVTSDALVWSSPFISSWTTSGFFTMHLNSSEVDPVAKGAMLAVALGGAEYEVGVGNENITDGCRSGG